MPPRLFVAIVVAGWLAAMAWLVVDRWLPWWRPVGKPPFAYDLADEVAPEHASWKLYRQGKRAGSAETKMAPRKDGTFELTTRLRDLNMDYGGITIKMPLFATTRIVSREGELISVDAKSVMEFRGLVQVRIDASIKGRVFGDEYHSEIEFDSGDSKSSESLEPIKLVSKNALSPLHPLHKFPKLRPGQTWQVANIDLLSQAIDAATRQVLSKRFGINPVSSRQPTALLARVRSETEQITHGDKTFTCWVIEYHADRDIAAKSWVDVTNGRVVRQEAMVFGRALMLQRD